MAGIKLWNSCFVSNRSATGLLLQMVDANVIKKTSVENKMRPSFNALAYANTICGPKMESTFILLR